MENTYKKYIKQIKKHSKKQKTLFFYISSCNKHHIWIKSFYFMQHIFNCFQLFCGVIYHNCTTSESVAACCSFFLQLVKKLVNKYSLLEIVAQKSQLKFQY